MRIVRVLPECYFNGVNYNTSRPDIIVLDRCFMSPPRPEVSDDADIILMPWNEDAHETRSA